MLKLFADSAPFKLNFKNTKHFYIGKKRTFTPVFEPLIQIVQRIYRWINNENAQLFHVLRSFKFHTVFE
jgi:hypothetical protein